jgi:GTP cyclohydrolase IA
MYHVSYAYASAQTATANLSRQGYDRRVEDVINGAIFEEYHHEMILVKDIDIYSLCEHHMVPFFGKVHIAYIPRSKVSELVQIISYFEVSILIKAE